MKPGAFPKKTKTFFNKNEYANQPQQLPNINTKGVAFKSPSVPSLDCFLLLVVDKPTHHHQKTHPHTDPKQNDAIDTKEKNNDVMSALTSRIIDNTETILVEDVLTVAAAAAEVAVIRRLFCSVDKLNLP